MRLTSMGCGRRWCGWDGAACGAMGLVTVLEACRLLGARGASVLEYTTSGDVTGQRAPGVYTVGYLAAAIYG